MYVTDFQQFALGSAVEMGERGLMWVQIDKVHEGTGANHAISALKYKIIREFLDLGWSVLLSDVDIVVVQVAAPTLLPILVHIR